MKKSLLNNTRKNLSMWIIAIVLTMVLSAAIIYPSLNPEEKTSPPHTRSSSPTTSTTTATTSSPSPILSPTIPPQTISPSPTPPTTTPIDSKITTSQGIKVYGENYPDQISSIDWGTIFVQIPQSYNISISNIGDRPIILYLAVNNWTPGVNGTISWSYEGKAVAPGERIPITLFLKIESANVTAFSNEISVTGTSIL